MTETNRSIATT